MNQGERDQLLASLKKWKPKQHVEIRVDKLIWLLETLNEFTKVNLVLSRLLLHRQTADESETPSPLPLCEAEEAKS